MRRYTGEPGDSLLHLTDVGLHGGLDRISTMTLYNSLTSPNGKGILRTITCDGVRTARSRSLLPRSADLSNVCQYCESGAVETLHHLWWWCPAWDSTRRTNFEYYPYDVLTMNFAEWPQCHLSWEVKNLDTVIPEGLITDVQNKMLHVLKAREEAKKSES